MNRYLYVIILFTIFSCTSPNVNKKNVIRQNNRPEIGGVFHTIKEGESLWALSRGYNVSLEDIIEINDINPKTILYPGDEIFIPGVKRRIDKPIIIKSNDKNDKNNYKYRRAGKRVNPQKSKENYIAKEYKNKIIWPVNGVVITDYGLNGNFKSDGMDIAAPLGSEVLAVYDGKVIYSGNQPGYGNIIIIKHEKDMITIYAHNNKNLVKKGQIVKKGQKIATTGITGAVLGDHLHFGILVQGIEVNPIEWMDKNWIKLRITNIINSANKQILDK